LHQGILRDDFTDDLKKITVPRLVMHGDDDQIVPFEDSAPLTARLVQNGRLKFYNGFPHAMCTKLMPTLSTLICSSSLARRGSGSAARIGTKEFSGLDFLSSECERGQSWLADAEDEGKVGPGAGEDRRNSRFRCQPTGGLIGTCLRRGQHAHRHTRQLRH
jgi:hypothetical protein